MGISTSSQLKKRVTVVTKNGDYSGVLLEEHDRNFIGGCIDLMYEGTVFSHNHAGVIVGRHRGMKKMSIPRKNVIQII